MISKVYTENYSTKYWKLSDLPLYLQNNQQIIIQYIFPAHTHTYIMHISL